MVGINLEKRQTVNVVCYIIIHSKHFTVSDWL